MQLIAPPPAPNVNYKNQHFKIPLVEKVLPRIHSRIVTVIVMMTPIVKATWSAFKGAILCVDSHTDHFNLLSIILM